MEKFSSDRQPRSFSAKALRACACVFGVAFAALLVIGIAVGNGVFAALSVIAALISVAFLYAFSWTARRQSQLDGVRTRDDCAADKDRFGSAGLVTPRAAGGAALLLRHPFVVVGVLIPGIGGPVLAAYSIANFPLSSGSGTVLLAVGCFAFVSAIAGGVAIPGVMLMQDDIARLIRSRMRTFAWGYTTSVGLSAWIAKSRRADPGFTLRKAGYVLVSADSIEFWQRGPSDLEQIVVVPRELVREVRVGEGSYGYQSLRAVLLSVEDADGATDAVPLLVRGKTTNWQAYFHAPEQFLQAWRAL